jgi:hypothetical protein
MGRILTETLSLLPFLFVEVKNSSLYPFRVNGVAVDRKIPIRATLSETTVFMFSPSPPRSPMSHCRSLSLLVFAALSGLVLTVASAQAQPKNDTTGTTRPPALQAGGWGLQYEAKSLDGALSGFQGSLFSGRYHLSSRSVVRAGVSLRVSSDESDRTRTDTDENGTEETTIDTENAAQEYGLFGQYLRYFRASEQFFVFAGAGPPHWIRNDNTERDRRSVAGRQDVHRAVRGRIDHVSGRR